MKNKWLWITILFVVFVVLAVLVKLNLLENFDTFCYNLIASNITQNKTSVYKIITFFGSTLFIILLCAFFVVLFIFLKRRNTGLFVGAVLVISTIVNNVIKLIIMRERPLVTHLVTESTYSFPSGHTMASVSMYGVLLYLVLKSNLKKSTKIFLSIILGLIPILVGISRIYLGAHFASDIVGGIIMSLLLLLIEIYYIEKKEWLVVK